jgi:PH domain
MGHTQTAADDVFKSIELKSAWPKVTPTKQGYLRKEGEHNSFLRRRWMVLTHCFLFYYHTSTDILPRGVICLYPRFAVSKRRGKSDKCLTVDTPARIYELKADSNAEGVGWRDLLTTLSQKDVYLPRDESENLVLWTEPGASSADSSVSSAASASASSPSSSLLGGRGAAGGAAAPSPPRLSVSSRQQDHRGSRRRSRRLGVGARGVRTSGVISVDREEVLHESLLYKLGMVRKTWVVRWFALMRDLTLYYFEAKRFNTEQKPKGAILVAGASFRCVEESELTGSSRKMALPSSRNTSTRFHFFELTTTGGDVYVLATDNEPERDRWERTFGRIARVDADIIVEEDLPPSVRDSARREDGLTDGGVDASTAGGVTSASAVAAAVAAQLSFDTDLSQLIEEGNVSSSSNSVAEEEDEVCV